jgi:hypothetical protein
MKKLLYLLILLCFPMIAYSQFEMKNREIKYTNYVTQEQIKKYWENTNEEFDDLEGIYEPLSAVDESVLGYVLGVIKVNEYFEIIMLGKPYGFKDVIRGGVKATAKKMPAEGVYKFEVANGRCYNY